MGGGVSPKRVLIFEIGRKKPVDDNPGDRDLVTSKGSLSDLSYRKREQMQRTRFRSELCFLLLWPMINTAASLSHLGQAGGRSTVPEL